MADKGKKDSIIRRVNNTGSFFTIVLISFMLLNLLMMYAFQRRYDQFSTEIGMVSELKNVVSDEIPDEIWEVITGRETMNECKAFAKLNEVEAKLKQIHLTAVKKRSCWWCGGRWKPCGPIWKGSNRES